MIIKTYRCPLHGEFDHECNIGDEKLKECPKLDFNGEYPRHCGKEVQRVFKALNYSDSVGFYGKGR